MAQKELVNNDQKLELTYIEFGGQSYPCRRILMPDECTYTVSVESLSNALFDENEDFVSAEAEQIDDEISFFLPEADFYRPESELVALITDALS